MKGAEGIAKKGTRYYVVIDLGPDPETGKRRRKWHGSWTTMTEAKAARVEILGTIQTATYVPPRRQTLAAFLTDDWLPAIKGTVRPSTFESYRRYLALHVIPQIGGVQLRDLDGARLNALYARLRTDGARLDSRPGALSPRTVRYIHTILHRALRDAVRWGRVARNVADAADPPSNKAAQEAAPEMTTWSGAELVRFLDWTEGDRYNIAWAFLATTGMRRGEALGLTWEDIDFDANKASIRRAITAINHSIERGATKSGKSRVIELDTRTVAALRSHRARQAAEKLRLGSGYQDQGLIFTLPDGRPYHPERLSREFDRKQSAYNREHPGSTLPRLRLHDLRHTWATLALKAGVHPKVVAERLGHANTNVTLNVYSHVTAGMQSDAAEKVAASIFGGGA